MQNRIILRKYDMGGAFGNLLGFHSSENCQPARHSSANINNYQHVGSQIAVFAIPPKCLANQTRGAKLCKKNYMISYDINQTGWTKRLLILLNGNIGMKPPMYSTHQHGAQKWVYCDAKPRTFFGISVSHKTFHHVNSNFELLDIMTKCLDQSPSWQVFDQKTIRTNCIRHQCVNHSGFTELKNFSGTTKFNDYDRRIQTTIRRKHR